MTRGIRSEFKGDENVEVYDSYDGIPFLIAFGEAGGKRVEEGEAR